MKPAVLRELRLPAAFHTRLFLIDLDAPPDEPFALAADEEARAARFVFERDARRYRAGRAALRWLLGDALGIAPAQLRFVLGEFDKPALAPGQGAQGGLAFNLSHSGGLGLLGLADIADHGTRRLELGVDIEQLSPMDDTPALATRHFTPTEQAELGAAADADRTCAFLRGWTRKEACLKAVGSGLSIEPETFEAGLSPGRRSVEIPWAGRLARVEVESIDIDPSAVAAVAWWVN